MSHSSAHTRQIEACEKMVDEVSSRSRSSSSSGRKITPKEAADFYAKQRRARADRELKNDRLRLEKGQDEMKECRF